MKAARRFIELILMLAGIIAIPWFAYVYHSSPAQATSSGAKEEVLFTCGMHPQVIQNKPGNCPICGIKLTPMRKGGSEGFAASSNSIRIDPVTMQNMGLRTAIVTNGLLRQIIRTVGTIDFDETRLSEVTTKYKGWIEKLHVNATGQIVKKGDPLFEIYSPELFSVQTEYLLASASGGFQGVSSNSFLSSARSKLAYLDFSDDQIATLDKERQARRTLQIRAPRDGIVMEKMVVEGQMVDAGMKLYRIADLATVWAFCQVYEKDLPAIKVGQEASVALSYQNDAKFAGKVAFIYPMLDEKTRAARVRVELANADHQLMPGMFVTVELRTRVTPDVLLVPDMAVLRSGESNTVFIALSDGRFEARTVKIGLRAENNQYQVLDGLKEGERIVTSGQFMLDSESQLREAIQKMSMPVSPPRNEAGTNIDLSHQSPHAAHEKNASNASTSAGLPKVLYTCPMEADADVVSDHPGVCPKCEMELVETSKVKHGKVAEENWRKQHPVRP